MRGSDKNCKKKYRKQSMKMIRRGEVWVEGWLVLFLIEWSRKTSLVRRYLKRDLNVRKNHLRNLRNRGYRNKKNINEIRE